MTVVEYILRSGPGNKSSRRVKLVGLEDDAAVIVVENNKESMIQKVNQTLRIIIRWIQMALEETGAVIICEQRGYVLILETSK